MVVVDIRSCLTKLSVLEEETMSGNLGNLDTEVPVVPVDLEVLAVLGVLVGQLWLCLEGLSVLHCLADLVVPENPVVLVDLVVHHCLVDLDIPLGQEDPVVLGYRRCLEGQAVLVLVIHLAMSGHHYLVDVVVVKVVVMVVVVAVCPS